MFFDKVSVFKTVISREFRGGIIPGEYYYRYAPGEADNTDGAFGDFAEMVGDKFPAGIEGLHTIFPGINSSRSYIAGWNKAFRAPFPVPSPRPASAGNGK